LNGDQLEVAFKAASYVVEQKAIASAVAFRAIYLELSKAEIEIPATIIAQMSLSVVDSIYEAIVRSQSSEKSEVADV